MIEYGYLRYNKLIMDERALVVDALQGDVDAFNRLVLAYQDMAFNVACRMLTDEDLAADAVQNAFLLTATCGVYRGGSFKAWVMRMVTNGCYDELRAVRSAALLFRLNLSIPKTARRWNPLIGWLPMTPSLKQA